MVLIGISNYTGHVVKLHLWL